jgi:hypothetical protein
MMAGQYEKAFTGHYRTIAQAATGAIKEAAELAKSAARSNIASAGFSERWQNALRANTYPKSGESIDAAALVYHKIPYAGIFERGGTITGKPLLWIPLGQNLSGGNRLTPKSATAAFGPLKVMARGGKVFLVGKVGKKSVPLFVGVASVREPKKFDVIATVKKIAAKLPELYAKNLKT